MKLLLERLFGLLGVMKTVFQAQKEGDMVIGDFEDTYGNLTVKVLILMFEYTVICDSHVRVNGYVPSRLSSCFDTQLMNALKQG